MKIKLRLPNLDKIVLLIIPSLIIFGCMGDSSSIERIPYTIFDDFETGELYGWEQYPYAEDIGFDALFSTHETPTHNNSKYALARPVKPNDIVEVYQGFTKRIDIWTLPETKVKMAIYLQSDRNAEKLDVSLGTFEGELYHHIIENVEANQWIELDIPIEAFKSENGPLKAGEHIQVATIEASYPQVYYLYTYTILMDDFSINGERERQFIATTPPSENFDMFGVSVLKKHFFHGQDIALRTKPEGNVQLNQVKGTLFDGQGNIVKQDITFEEEGGEWINESIYSPTEKDATGQWEIVLEGTSGDGKKIAWGFKFLMPGKRPTEHPRLFFSKGELKERLENETSPVAKKILENALEDTDFMEVDIASINEGVDYTAENLVGGPYSKTSVGFNAYAEWNNPNRALGRIIEEGSFRYAFTGDREAGEKAKEALLKLCAFKKWNAAWMLERQFWTYYPVGYTLLPVSYGYDLLHDLLTEEEQKMVREAIMEKGLKLFHRDMVEMNRMSSNLTNHIAVLVGGHGVAATAIYGDDPDNPYLEPYLSGIITKAKAFIDNTYYEDGSYGEPKSGYMNMATREIVLIMEAFERNFGIDWTESTNVKSFYKYPLQATHPSGIMPDFGDGGHTFGGFSKLHSGSSLNKKGSGWSSIPGFTQDHAQYFVYRMGNPYLYPHVKSFWDEGKGGYFGYLWYRDDIDPVSRNTLPSSKIFNAQGMVMRSGWDDASTIISVRMGPHSNHYHFDQGTFQINVNGERLLTDPEYGKGGYYANLDYNLYNIQAIAHNVMLVDHDPESQKAAHYDNGIAAHRIWPRTHGFAGEIADAFEGDLTSVYKDKLEKYNRTMLFNKSRAMFLLDQVKSKSTEGHVYDWLFHAPENSMDYKNNRVTIDRPKARMTIDIISPKIESGVIRTNKDDAESFVTLTSAPNLTEANFMAVLLPEPQLSGAFGQRPQTARIDEEGWLAAQVKYNDGTVDVGAFRVEEASNEIFGFSTDANRFTASLNRNGTLDKVYFEGNDFKGYGISIKSGVPITFAWSSEPSTNKLEVQSDKETELEISMDRSPSSVTMNGSEHQAWEYVANDGLLKIMVPSGRNDISIKR
ncbi:DUF4962 domain-containing protein [Flagellimonas olearia]|uniref:DUF4962 domain-containing protein n=2 Tax=Flagellimonas olearia TaxID=552546 RepID=A0A6I1DXV3_9FLAO|nr:DUF4962 domain-containing protein [Allomuricauda olearia]